MSKVLISDNNYNITFSSNKTYLIRKKEIVITKSLLNVQKQLSLLD